MIEAQEVAFGYRRGEAVINGWSGFVERGETVAITGASGRGKSTLLYLLGALVRPWSGSLRIAGVEIGRLDDSGRADIRSRDIGFVFQDGLLDTRRSVLDNVVEGAVYRGASRPEAVSHALALLDEFEVGVEPRRRAVDLSGGQVQRVALCRALLGRPSIILADEPSGNLDARNAAIVEAALFGQARNGVAVVIASHNEGLVSRCDRWYRL